MLALLAILLIFMAGGLAQAVLAGRLVDMIHGGPGRRAPRGRRLDVLILRVAGIFVAIVALVALVAIYLLGALS